MDRSPHPTLRWSSSTQSRFRAGVLLCALVILFSLIAKVSWYNAHSAPKTNIASLKAFQAELPDAAAVAAHLPANVPLSSVPALLVVFALFCCLPAMQEFGSRRPARVRRRVSPLTTARPPPSRRIL